METMFSDCSSLKELDLSNFHTNNVINMNDTSPGCLLEKIDLSNFITDNVINMSGMFSRCPFLKKLNLSNFNTNKVIKMNFMFSKSSSLKELDLSNFNTSNLKTKHHFLLKYLILIIYYIIN